MALTGTHGARTTWRHRSGARRAGLSGQCLKMWERCRTNPDRCPDDGMAVRGQAETAWGSWGSRGSEDSVGEVAVVNLPRHGSACQLEECIEALWPANGICKATFPHVFAWTNRVTFPLASRGACRQSYAAYAQACRVFSHSRTARRRARRAQGAALHPTQLETIIRAAPDTFGMRGHTA
jgi:hypothetical protein